MPKLILWDVDATLLQTQGVSAQAMRAAIGQVFAPIPERERAFFSGKTDWRVICDSFPHLTPEAVGEKLPAFRQAYVEELQRRYDDLRARAHLLPGVLPLLHHLHEQGVIQAPLTGNVAPIARMKLELLDLDRYLNLRIGAYGDDHYERAQLVPIAVERATQYYGYPFTSHDLVVIGDTPSDIQCGKASGARTVAVETGPYRASELLRYQPDAILPDLSNLEQAVAAILAGHNQ